MEAYTDFAYVYDTLMDNTPYEKWCEQVTAILQSHGIKEDLVLFLLKVRKKIFSSLCRMNSKMQLTLMSCPVFSILTKNKHKNCSIIEHIQKGNQNGKQTKPNHGNRAYNQR